VDIVCCVSKADWYLMHKQTPRIALRRASGIKFPHSLPSGKAMKAPSFRYQGFVVDDYSGNLAAMKLEPSWLLKRWGLQCVKLFPWGKRLLASVTASFTLASI
jgi:hypothetical protein